MPEDKIERIEKIDESIESIESKESKPEISRVTPDKEHFDTLMREEKQAAALPGREPGKASLMDTVRDMHNSQSKPGQVSHDTLVAETQEAVVKIEEIKHTLESPNINIKGSVQPLLQNKLSHINESLKIALSRAGVEYSPTEAAAEVKTPGRVNPIERFLHFLTDGQMQLQNLGSELRIMAMNNKEISPVNMLAIQVKVGQIQQELELFSSLLNKGLESIKTIMNIQV